MSQCVQCDYVLSEADRQSGKCPSCHATLEVAPENTPSTMQPFALLKHRWIAFPDDPHQPDADYELIEKIDEDDIVEAYTARQVAANRRVTVLKLLKEEWVNSERKNGFLTEATILTDLNHPNILSVYDTGLAQKERPFYAMEPVPGSPWSESIHQKPLRENLGYLRRIADALQYAHAHGVIHRDVNPHNLILGEKGQVILTAWSSAAWTHRDGTIANYEKKQVLVGTPQYMPPEIAKGELDKIGIQSDVYMLGAVLFEILTKHPPHPGTTEMACLNAAAENKLHSTDSQSNLLEAAYKALSTQIDDRYESVSAFLEAIQQYLVHDESLQLSEKAKTDLIHAQQVQDYDHYSKALVGFRNALEVWSDNREAQIGELETIQAYAQCALNKDNPDLAASFLDKDNPDHDALSQKVQEAFVMREIKERRGIWIARLAAGLGIVAALILGLSFLQITAEKQRVELEKEKAEMAQQEATSQQIRAERLNYFTDITVADNLIGQGNVRKASDVPGARTLRVSWLGVWTIASTHTNRFANAACTFRGSGFLTIQP